MDQFGQDTIIKNQKRNLRLGRILSLNMKIISWNVNGVRACHKKGQFLSMVEAEDPDIVCLQELKAQEVDLPEELLNIPGYHSYFNTATKRGYAGVAVYSKEKPISVGKTNGLDRFDGEGRILKLKFKDFTLLALYIPHGGRQKENLEYKILCYKKLFEYIKKSKEKIILAGDFNIAHTEIDLERPKNNKNNIMFTPEERATIDKLLDIGFIDSFRQFHQDGGHYTWWPWLANARARNLGWRIDYIFVANELSDKLKSADTLDKVYGSDHCPISIELK